MDFSETYTKFNVAQNKQIVIFDGNCKLCNFFVKLILKYDKKDCFRFAHLQSPFGKQVLKKLNYKTNSTYETVILITSSNFFIKSTAALKIIKELWLIGKLFYWLRIIPIKFRDSIYTLIATNRFKIFGKKKVCNINQKISEKFIYSETKRS